ncbi:MAG TPA: hypothetical protein VFK13_11400 [Gemmatimonadaceae bacterium]|nr:hypothetical protein [Gemmatimonadaceae bacterium]
MAHSTNRTRRTGFAAARAAVTGALVLLAAAGCKDILQVDDPGAILPGALPNELGARTAVTGAIGEFNRAYSGSGGDAFLSNNANFTDELMDSETFPTRTATDKRDQFPFDQGNTTDGTYSRLHRARHLAVIARDLAAQFITDPEEQSADVALMNAIEGFSDVALAEAFCSGIPLSSVDASGAVTFGAPLTTDQVLDSAIVYFDLALAAATPGSDEANLASVGKGRALLDKGDVAGAAAAVASVPTEFVFRIGHSDTDGSENNPIFSLQLNGRYTIVADNPDNPAANDNEGVNGQPFRAANDPRVPWKDIGPGFDASIEVFSDELYNSLSEPVPFATGVEARLIQAEAAQQASDASWLTILNDLRDDVGTLMAGMYPNYEDQLAGSDVTNTTLGPLSDPGTPAAQLDLIFSERAFWMFITGHRLGDLRRLVRNYGRAQNTVFPDGPYHKGGEYGNDVAWPIPQEEQNNPLWVAEFPNGCDVDTP